MSTASLTVVSWMNPARRKTGEEWVAYFRRWRVSTRTRFNALGHSLCGPAQVKRRLTFAGHLARMDDTRIAKQVLDFRSLFEWRTPQSLVGDGGGGGDPSRHRGRGVSPCDWEKTPEQASNMWQETVQHPQQALWTELVVGREVWRKAVKRFAGSMQG